jgi:hypothetical protein
MTEKKRLKTGQLGPADKEFILANASRMTAEAIAAHISRTEALVRRFIEEYAVPLGSSDDPEVSRQAIRTELRNSHKWGRLKRELAPDELEYFEEEYVKTIGQFRDDILPTEETQIFQSIKLDILMSRSMISRRKAVEDAERIERAMRGFLSRFDGDHSRMNEAERSEYLHHEDNLQAVKAGEAQRTAEHQKLQNEHSKLVREMKGTRDQRIKEVEAGKVSFLGLLKMLQQREQQERIGRQNELMKMAADKEFRRLARYHTYEDGTVDRPVLSAESLEADLDGD